MNEKKSLIMMQIHSQWSKIILKQDILKRPENDLILLIQEKIKNIYIWIISEKFSFPKFIRNNLRIKEWRNFKNTEARPNSTGLLVLRKSVYPVKGEVRSKITRGYFKVDGLGEKLLFTRIKSDKNWPRYGVSNMQILLVLKTH